jgi:ferritin-like metal-binding protein YciE
MKTLKHLFLEELADRYDSESQLVQAMPKMAEAATEPALKQLILGHLKQTELHVTSLEKVFKAFGEKPKAKKCQGTIGLLKESEETIASFKGTQVIDAALISTAQKVEHYEIASYGCLHEWAKDLRNAEAVGILEGILKEEKEANKSLTELARAHSNNDALGNGVSANSCGDSKSSCGTMKDGHKPSPVAV